MAKVLVIDDDREIRHLLNVFFRGKGHIGSFRGLSVPPSERPSPMKSSTPPKTSH